MLTLDATTFTHEENTVGCELKPTYAAAGIRRITLPLPDSCRTAVGLLFLPVIAGNVSEGPEQHLWTCGFRVHRDYDTEPHDAATEELPDLYAVDEDLFDSLRDAIVSACERAAWWITINSGIEENSEEAIAAIDAWRLEFEENVDKDSGHVNESIFDEEADKTSTVAVVEAEEAAAVATPPQEAVPQAAPQDTTMVVTDEAQLHYDQRRRAIEEILCKLVIREADVKNQLKSTRESIKLQREELEQHLERGPERMPPFELQAREKAKQAAEEKAAEKAAEKTEPAAAPAASDGLTEPWRQTKIADLAGLTPKIVAILAAENIHTVGEWVDWPAAANGREYTQIKNAAGSITEARYEKLATAINQATCVQQ